MSEAGEFVDATLRLYGSSVGAVRGAIRDASRKFPGMSHDDITALSSELWTEPVYERRLAAIVLLQTHIDVLIVTDLTRIEGFIRSATVDELLDPLIELVVVPMASRLHGTRADAVFERWRSDGHEGLRRAADAG